MTFNTFRFRIAAVFAAFALIISFAACNNDDDTTPTPTPAVPDGFTWTEIDGNPITADSAFWTSGSWGTGIRAYKNGMDNFFEINFGTAATGPQALGTGLTFLKGSATYTSTSGSVVINSNTDYKLTGTFTAPVTGGSITSVAGTFTNLPKR